MHVARPCMSSTACTRKGAVCNVRPLRRRLLVFPRGNNNSSAGHVSIFLDAPEAEFTPPKMTPCAEFKVILVNASDPSKSYEKSTWGQVAGSAARAALFS